MVGDSSGDLGDEISKRLTLNMLIQGVATHAMLTAHHLVGDELDALGPNLVDDYDRLTVNLYLGIWMGDIIFLTGRPDRFWRRINQENHPFHRHRLLARHGGALANQFKRELLDRAERKGVARIPFLHLLQQMRLFYRVSGKEVLPKKSLEQLASATAAQIWSIDQNRLEGEISTNTQIANIRDPNTWRGKVLRVFAAGWGGVEQREQGMVVVARAMCWPLLVHELVKGTAELICLHGLANLPEDQYTQVIEAADHIEFESWHMQTGVTLWRNLLKLLPPGAVLSEILMHLARLEPRPLESLMLQIIEEPEAARAILKTL